MPKKMTAAERAMALLAADATEEETAQLAKIKEEKQLQQSEEDAALEAEAVLLYFNLKGKGFYKQICPECGREFAYKYALAVLDTKKMKKGNQEEVIAYKKSINKFRCSNKCRKDALARIGMEWNPDKLPEERWGMNAQMYGVIPLIVAPDALEIVESKIQEYAEDKTASAS